MFTDRIRESYREYPVASALSEQKRLKLRSLARRHSVLTVGERCLESQKSIAQVARRLHIVDADRRKLERAALHLATAPVELSLMDPGKRWTFDDAEFGTVILGQALLDRCEFLPFLFLQARRVIAEGGELAMTCMHPLRRRVVEGRSRVRWELHDVVQAAVSAGYAIAELHEWWDPGHTERDLIPSMLFARFETVHRV